MLNIKANLTYRPGGLAWGGCKVTKVMELPEKEFECFTDCPPDGLDFVMENRSLMFWRDRVPHCMLVLQEGGNDGMLVEAFCYYGPWNAKYISHARDLIQHELERDADSILQNICPDEVTGNITIHIDGIEDCDGHKYKGKCRIADMFHDALLKHPGVREVTASGDCLIVTPVQAQKQGTALRFRLRDLLQLGSLENAYIVHESADIWVPGSYFETMTDESRKAYAGILEAYVQDIRPGEYGPEIVLSGISPELLMKCSRTAQRHERAEPMLRLAM